MLWCSGIESCLLVPSEPLTVLDSWSRLAGICMKKIEIFGTLHPRMFPPDHDYASLTATHRSLFPLPRITNTANRMAPAQPRTCVGKHFVRRSILTVPCQPSATIHSLSWACCSKTYSNRCIAGEFETVRAVQLFYNLVTDFLSPKDRAVPRRWRTVMFKMRGIIIFRGSGEGT